MTRDDIDVLEVRGLSDDDLMLTKDVAARFGIHKMLRLTADEIAARAAEFNASAHEPVTA